MMSSGYSSRGLISGYYECNRLKGSSLKVKTHKELLKAITVCPGEQLYPWVKKNNLDSNELKIDQGGSDQGSTGKQQN